MLVKLGQHLAIRLCDWHKIGEISFADFFFLKRIIGKELVMGRVIDWYF